MAAAELCGFTPGFSQNAALGLVLIGFLCMSLYSYLSIYLSGNLSVHLHLLPIRSSEIYSDIWMALWQDFYKYV